VVRHPIYSGGTLAMPGTATATNEARCLLGAGLGLAGWWLKWRVEEAFLRKQVGEEYAAYQREVKALIPFVL
jgi:protein-S-isoprenylcysteine O-methyltransferase Ste14